MAIVQTSQPVKSVSGKLHHNDRGYFYTDRQGRQLYRHREENYQRNQSPRQKWNSAAFAYAHRQLAVLAATKEGKAKMEQEYKEAGRINSTGTKKYATAANWKFAALQQEWKLSHPLDQWYVDYVASIQQSVEEKTSSSQVSKNMLKQQINLLTDQLATLREQLDSIK